MAIIEPLGHGDSLEGDAIEYPRRQLEGDAIQHRAPRPWRSSSP